MTNITTTTQDYTHVSWTTGVDGAILHVSRIRWTTDETIARNVGLYLTNRWRDAESMEFVSIEEAAARILAGDEGTMIAEYSFMTPMDADGRRFASLDDARAFALTHGYTQRYISELKTEKRIARLIAARRECPTCGSTPMGDGCYHICPNSTRYYSPEQERYDDAMDDGSDDMRERYAATIEPSQYDDHGDAGI